MGAVGHVTSPGSTEPRPGGTPSRRARRRPGRATGAVLTAALGLGALLAACSGNGAADPPLSRPPTGPTEPSEPGTSSPAGTDPVPQATTVTARIALRPVVDGLDRPTALAPRPGTDELWLTEQGGTVRRVRRPADAGTAGSTAARAHELDPTPVLDLGDLTRAGGERGLLGIAFSPGGDTVYLHHTAPEGDVVVAAYAIAADGSVDAGARRVLLTVEHRRFSNHNGGQLVLGPDELLYVGVGDGGGAGDPDDRAQDTDQLLGKVLRIDPSRGEGDRPYAIPADNPFASGGGAPEVYLYGARNPWRFSFDRATGDLWVADVGQNEVEEIDWLPAAEGAGRGANLGWPWFEGDQRFRTGGTPPDGLVGPIHTYGHAGGNCSVTGGFVYRGAAVPALEGVYLYGDYCGGEVRGLLARDGVVLDDQPLGSTLAEEGLVSFGQDADGELYVLAGDGTLLLVEGA